MLQATASSPKRGESNSLFPAHKKATDHLYLRGNIYYFRYALPKKLKERMGQSEIRVSLRTGFLQEARKLSRHIWSRFTDEFMADKGRTIQEIRDFITREWEEKFKAEAPDIIEGQPAPDLEYPGNMRPYKFIKELEEESVTLDQCVTLPALKDYLAKEIEKLYPECPNRAGIEISEIRQRMNKLRQILMDEIDRNLYETANEIFIDDSPGVFHCTVPIWLDLQYELFLSPLTNNPRKLIRAYFPTILQEMETRGLFTPAEFTPDNVLFLLNEYNKVLISINRIHWHRDKGEFGYEKQFETCQTPLAPVPQDTTPPTPQKKMLLSEFISLFIDTKIKDGKWVQRSIPDHRNRIEILLDVLGDIPVTEIDRAKMRKFREIIRRLPPNRLKDKKYKDKSVEEILAMKPAKTLSIGTIDTILNTISGMFEWGIREELIDKNPAKDLVLGDPEQDIDKRNPLSEEDIRAIFFSGDYKPAKFKNSAYYWVPLIGLYTGMRLEEICQLHTEDIYEEEGVWLFDIRPESTDGLNDKILKTKNSARKVPIHKDLLELGLIDYLHEVSKEYVRLFPGLNKTEKSPKYGKQVGKRFSALLKEKNISGKKSFHSLRHSFSDYFKKLNLHNDLFTQVMGHKQEKLAANRYGSRFSPKQCYEELISKIKYI